MPQRRKIQHQQFILFIKNLFSQKGGMHLCRREQSTISYLKERRKKDFHSCTKVVNVHLDSDKKNLLIEICKCMQELVTFKHAIKEFSTNSRRCPCFWCKGTLVRTCVLNECKRNASNKRKQRSKAGEALFNVINLCKICRRQRIIL